MDPGACPHCGVPVFKSGAGKIKARTSCLIVHKSGAVEINCPTCKNGVMVPMKFVAGPLQKGSTAPRFVVRR